MILAAVIMVTLTIKLFAGQPKPVPRPPAKTQFTIEVLPKYYIPADAANVMDLKTRKYYSIGTSKSLFKVPTPEVQTIEIQVVSIVLKNMSNKKIEDVKVDYTLYKESGQGKVSELASGSEKVSLPPFQTTILIAQGELTIQLAAPKTIPTQTTADLYSNEDKFYGWYVKIDAGGDRVIELADPPKLADLAKPK